MPKTYFRMTASAKLGIAINRNEFTVDIRSAGLFALAALISAQGIAIMAASNCAMTSRVNDRGKRSFTSSLTGG